MPTHLESLLRWRPPANRRDAGGWDAFWVRILQSIPDDGALPAHLGFPPGNQASPHLTPEWYRYIRGSIYDDTHKAVIRILRLMDYRVVNIPGCGLSNAPYFYAHQGFEVIATDISAVALDACERYQPSPSAWGMWLPGEAGLGRTQVSAIRDLLPNEVEASRHPSGALRFKQHDSFDALPDGTVDAIVVAYLLDLYGPEERQGLFRAFRDGLRPGGILAIQSPSAGVLKSSVEGSMPGLRGEAESHGFSVYGQGGRGWLGDRAVGQDVSWEEWSAANRHFETEDLQRLASGERMVMLLPG